MPDITSENVSLEVYDIYWSTSPAVSRNEMPLSKPRLASDHLFTLILQHQRSKLWSESRDNGTIYSSN